MGLFRNNPGDQNPIEIRFHDAVKEIMGKPSPGFEWGRFDIPVPGAKFSIHAHLLVPVTNKTLELVTAGSTLMALLTNEDISNIVETKTNLLIPSRKCIKVRLGDANGIIVNLPSKLWVKYLPGYALFAEINPTPGNQNLIAPLIVRPMNENKPFMGMYPYTWSKGFPRLFRR
ncbi:MAG: hypothetical protein KatS3mg084_0269 [Candidatus Dojkabacteria bacterium]|nr:MAG: hypothetical protein KatS3mg084_0269 [Candidatus Dojkabacteria bacterium]